VQRTLRDVRGKSEAGASVLVCVKRFGVRRKLSDTAAQSDGYAAYSLPVCTVREGGSSKEQMSRIFRKVVQENWNVPTYIPSWRRKNSV
jgi:hypothetical protein